MKRTPQTTSRQSTNRLCPQGAFTYQRGTDGCDDCFDIVFVRTGRVIATLPFWDEEPATRREARHLTRALNALYDRGGYFHVDALLAVN
jgi:hypothetical protein